MPTNSASAACGVEKMPDHATERDTDCLAWCGRRLAHRAAEGTLHEGSRRQAGPLTATPIACPTICYYTYRVSSHLLLHSGDAVGSGHCRDHPACLVVRAI